MGWFPGLGKVHHAPSLGWRFPPPGKTLVVNDKLMNGLEETFMPIFFTFSAQTTANQTQVQAAPPPPPHGKPVPTREAACQ